MLSPRRAMYTKICPSASNKQRDPHNLKQGNKARIDNGAVPLAGQSATVLGSLFCSFIFHFLFGKCFPALLLGVFCLSYTLFACVMSIGLFLTTNPRHYFYHLYCLIIIVVIINIITVA